MAARGVKL